MDTELDFLRQERRLRQERARVEAERRERERLAAEEQRRRAEALARQVTIRTVEKRNFLVNFVPFGAGQFQQGRTSLGVVFAASEGALAVTSVIAYFAYEALFETATVEIDDVLTETGKATLTVRYIPTDRAHQADAWRLLKIGSAAGFYTVYALGVSDALYHHEDQVVTHHHRGAACSASQRRSGPPWPLGPPPALSHLRRARRRAHPHLLAPHPQEPPPWPASASALPMERSARSPCSSASPASGAARTTTCSSTIRASRTAPSTCSSMAAATRWAASGPRSRSTARSATRTCWPPRTSSAWAAPS